MPGFGSYQPRAAGQFGPHPDIQAGDRGFQYRPFVERDLSRFSVPEGASRQRGIGNGFWEKGGAQDGCQRDRPSVSPAIGWFVRKTYGEISPRVSGCS